ncbi:MAG: TetR/AcrR family transcriptional regulator [Deltaproteobacteria bacterium]|nr:TetR/AcrR family transcriptional regulator [Deltaproteobacteria bacterium]
MASKIATKRVRSLPAQPAPPTDGRRRKRRVSRDDVLREATRLFAEKGYDGFTMGELATRIGLRKASLFHHFPTKDALYERVVGALLDAIHAHVSRALGAEGSILERVDVLSDALTVALGENPHAARLMVGEVVHGGPLTKALVGPKIDRVLEASRALVRAGQRAGVFDRGLDPTHVVLTLVGAHFLPFALDDVVERFAGAPPHHAAFVSARTVALRDQVRRILGVRR